MKLKAKTFYEHLIFFFFNLFKKERKFCLVWWQNSRIKDVLRQTGDVRGNAFSCQKLGNFIAECVAVVIQ